MILPHNEYLSSSKMVDIINSIFDDKTVEINIAKSSSFFDFDDDVHGVAECYFEYFKNISNEITGLIGEPLYCGTWDKAGAISEWISSLQLDESVVSLGVWAKYDVRFYLRCNWEDKDVPIELALGVEGCRPVEIT